MAIITFTGFDGRATYKCSPFESRLEWLDSLDIIGLDTETNYTDSILSRNLKVVTIADEGGKNIWVIQWEYLTNSQKEILLKKLEEKLCVIHNVSFDYSILLKYGCKLEKVYDTMLGEQVLNTGLSAESGVYGLQAIYQKRFKLDISKDEQLTFGDTDHYSDNQIEYAAIDTLRLGMLRKLQLMEMKAEDKRRLIDNAGLPTTKGMLKTIWWENEFVKAVGDMETTGIRFDKDQWYAIEDSIQPIYDKELDNINQIVKEDFYDLLLENSWIYKEDILTESIWGSTKKKQIILTELFDEPIEKTSKVELKKYLKENDPSFPPGLKLSGKAWDESFYPTELKDKYAVIKLLILNGKDLDAEPHLNAFLMSNMKTLCIEQGWVKQAGKVYINWNSPAQRVQVFRAIDPFIEDSRKETIAEYVDKHRLVPHYLIWSEVAYQLKQFGKDFYDDHVHLDGKHRTRYNQILSTGRLSSVKPNVLNIPRKNDVFRKCVVPDPGYSFINSDFDGQELVITAYLSGEPLWLDSLKKGYDTHSRNAELIFGQEWKDAALEDCAYYKDNTFKKCKCPEHEKMRDASKAISFGMLYGITEFSLSPRLDISVDQARDLMNKFFVALPNIKAMMTRFGEFGVNKGYIIEPVFGRVRKFEQWKLANNEHHEGIKRQSMNFPIQGAGSALLKIAIVFLRRTINQLGLRDKIQILMPYHDEISIQAKPEIAEQARELLENSMRKAAKVAGFPLLGASAAIGDSWFDAH